MAILVVGAAFSSTGDGVQWLAAFHRALNNVDSTASLCGRVLADNNRGQPVPIFGLLARPERAASHPDDSQNHNLTPPLYMFAGATAVTRTARTREAEREAGGLGRLGLGPRGLLGEEDERLARRRPDQPQ